MAYKVFVTPAASKQIEEAVKYYVDHATKKVAMSFLREYRHTVSDILKVRYFQVFYLNYRGRMMKKFPYIIFYTMDERKELIVVKAVFHTAQTPAKYPKE